MQVEKRQSHGRAPSHAVYELASPSDPAARYVGVGRTDDQPPWQSVLDGRGREAREVQRWLAAMDGPPVVDGQFLPAVPLTEAEAKSIADLRRRQIAQWGGFVVGQPAPKRPKARKAKPKAADLFDELACLLAQLGGGRIDVAAGGRGVSISARRANRIQNSG